MIVFQRRTDAARVVCCAEPYSRLLSVVPSRRERGKCDNRGKCFSGEGAIRRWCNVCVLSRTMQRACCVVLGDAASRRDDGEYDDRYERFIESVKRTMCGDAEYRGLER